MKHGGQEGEVALKVDISKAYDRVSWDYLHNRMVVMGFSGKWIKWMMICVTAVSYSISFQGSSIGPIVPKRGLSLALKSATEEGLIKGCCICRSAPSITHLLFADDSFLFIKATADETNIIKEVLNSYEVFSGQAVNYQKSVIFFSSNVRRDKQMEIKKILGVFRDIGDSKYLGLPSLIGCSKKRYSGNQCWNLINKTDTLVARVLKARYYPDCHLLQARRMGVLVTLGHAYGNQKKRRIWDEDKVKMYFNNEDANAILSTHIPQMCIKDKIAWSHSHNGQYTVKSGYQQWHKTHVDVLGLQHSKGWSKIWSIQVPHKIRIFLWRFCRNNVPVRNLLRGKGVTVPISCTMCTGDIEHLLHLFLDCRFAQECWQRMGLVYDMREVENASEWLLDN